MDFLINMYPVQVQAFRDLHQKYKNYLPAIFFALGFLLDILTLGEVDDLSNILILGFYLVASLVILGMEYTEVHTKKFQSVWLQRFFKYRNDIFHFLLGALLSAFTLFYFKSSSFSNSFIFMIFMLSLLLLNEVELFKNQGVVIRTSISMLCLISYLIYVVPILIGMTNPFIFYACILLALMVSTACFFLLTRLNQNKEKNLKQLFIPHACIALIFLGLYSLKVLPPIPLSLKYIGIFHGVEKIDGGYATKQIKPWWNFWNNGDENFSARPGDKIYMFTKIFAPGGFSGKVYIHWLRDTDDGLKTSDRIPLKITGGRSAGFRGFAYKSNYNPGDWQIRVETESGLEIGRVNFEVIKDKSNEKRRFILKNRD